MSRLPYQQPDEIAAFAELLASEGVRSFLEIGSKFGDTLNVVAGALPVGSKIVSIDLDRNGTDLSKTISDLVSRGYDARLIQGDSRKPDTVEKAKQHGPFDAVFIDGDHRLAGVTDDWNNYGPMCRIVAFHDVAWSRDPKVGKRIEVPLLWDAIKEQYRHVEFKMCPTGNNYGIGVLWTA